MPAPVRNPATDIAWLILLAAVWGSSFAAIRVAVVEIPPMSLVAFRVVIGALVLYAVMVARGQRLPSGWAHWKMGFLLALVGIGMPFFLIGWGQTRVESGMAAILMAVMPLATLVLAHFFNDGDRMTWGRLFGVAIGFGGVVVLVGPEALKGLGGDFPYQAAVAGGAFCYALNAILTRNMLPAPMLSRATMVMVAGAALSVVAALLLDGPYGLFVGAESLAAGVYLGVLPTGLATIVYFHLIEARGATFFSFVNYLNPVFGVMWGAALLGEALTATALGALATILLGIAVANVKFGRGET